jgi:hypothetical protein
MIWFDWFLVGWLLFGAVAGIAQVGKPRKPMTAGTQAIASVITLAIIAGLLWSHGAIR